MNQVALVGNITDDPELRYTQSGKAVANFTIAVSHRSKTNGQWNDVTDGFFSVACWNGLADNVAQSLKKGSRIVVAGKLVQRSSEVEGQKRPRSRCRSSTSVRSAIRNRDHREGDFRGDGFVAAFAPRKSPALPGSLPWVVGSRRREQGAKRFARRRNPAGQRRQQASDRRDPSRPRRP